MNSKNKKIITIIMIAILALITGGIISYYLYHQEKKDNDMLTKFEEKLEYKYELCNDTCAFSKNNYYKTIKYDTNIDEIKNIVDNINSESKKLHEQVLSSKLSPEQECLGTKNIYNYSFISSASFYNYVDSNYIVVGVQRTNYNICDGKYETGELEVNIYDVKNKKIISQEEFMKQKNITKEDIDNRINTYIQDAYDDIEIPTDIDYDSKKLFINTDGKLSISFKTKKYSDYEIIVFDQK